MKTRGQVRLGGVTWALSDRVRCVADGAIGLVVECGHCSVKVRWCLDGSGAVITEESEMHDVYSKDSVKLIQRAP